MRLGNLIFRVPHQFLSKKTTAYYWVYCFICENYVPFQYPKKITIYFLYIQISNKKIKLKNKKIILKIKMVIKRYLPETKIKIDHEKINCLAI